MFTGKYWVTKEEVIDTSHTEHAIYARTLVLGLEADDPLRVKSPFYVLKKDDVTRLKKRKFVQKSKTDVIEKEFYGVMADALARGDDPRWLAILHYDWVRVAFDHADCKVLNQGVLDRLRDKKFWEKQVKIDPDDILEISPLTKKTTYHVPVKLLKRGITVELCREFGVECQPIGG